jgi:hypothetical protein
MPASAGMTESYTLCLARGADSPKLQLFGFFRDRRRPGFAGRPGVVFLACVARYNDSRVISSFIRSFCRLSSVM